jgi:hypothetical protein
MRSSRREYRGWLLLAGIGIAACGSAPKTQVKTGDTLTTRERQERIGAMPIPGARGVTKALQIQDSAAARAGRLDTVGIEH